jgi:putative ribosome biogenesis GTPase RsgA
MNLNEVENKMQTDTESETSNKSISLEPNIQDVLISIIKLQSAIEQMAQKIYGLRNDIVNTTSANEKLLINKSDVVIQKIEALNKQTDSIPILTYRLTEKSLKDFDDIEKLKALLNEKIETAGTIIYFVLGLIAVNTLLIIYSLFFC